MAVTLPSNPHVVYTTLNYHLPPSRGGVDLYYPGTASDKRRKHDPCPVEVTDIRGSEDNFSLDVQGFEVVSHESREKAFDDTDRIREMYYPECAELVKGITGATTVHAVSHVVRKRTWDDAYDDEKDLKDNDKVSGGTPAHFVHVDMSDHGAETRIRDYLSAAEVSRLTQTRWAIINVWRPFGRKVERDNLAVCDARSVPDAALRPLTGILPKKEEGVVNYLDHSGGKVIELWNVLGPPDAEGVGSPHRWYYCSGLTPEEALLIKQFDSSRLEGRARRVPHSAFRCVEDGGPPRQSLEVRCLVFWEDEKGG